MAELWQRGRVTLVWSPGHDMHGLEIVMRRQPFGEVLDDWAAEGEEGRRAWAELTTAQRIESSRRSAVALGRLIVSWNLADDDGQPVVLPARDGTDEVDAVRGAIVLQHCDSAMMQDMRDAYVGATLRVSPPLSASSDAGPAPELEAGVPEEWAAAMPGQEVLST